MEKLLIVEDEFIIAQDIQNIVRQLGYAVMGTAKSAQEALTIIEQELPDLILLDIKIHGSFSGIDLAYIVETQYEIPYLYITSYADDETLKMINASKAIGYILKPFKKDDIARALQKQFNSDLT